MNRLSKISLSLIICAYLSAGALAGTGHASSLSGKVVETMDSGGYTYVLLEQKDDKIWVAVPKTQVTKGENMSFAPGAEMRDFESRTLNRKFDKIIFSSGVLGKGASKEETKSGGSQGNVAAPAGKIKVEKAAGPDAYTVAEVYMNQAALNGKNIVVRGKVIKVSQGILKKNWIHLQDGSGEAANKTHDLVVTSQDVPGVGDVVTVTGTMRKDKDFGSGYKYAVIIEDANIK